MKKHCLLLIFSLIFTQLSFTQKSSIPTISQPVSLNTSFLSCDKTEVSNADYREFTAWVYTFYGAEAYENVLPDSLVWDRIYPDVKPEPFSKFYFRHPAYDNYPVVGVSYEQALEYAQWRTNKINERIMFEKGVLKTPLKYGKTLNKTDEALKKQAIKNKSFVALRLPTAQEWEQMASVEKGDAWGLDAQNDQVKKARKQNARLFNLKTENRDLLSFTSPVTSFLPNNNHYNFIGNVAEMTADKNIAKGGSWFHTLEESKIKNNIAYEKPEACLGFILESK